LRLKIVLLVASLLAVLWSSVAWNNFSSENSEIESMRRQGQALGLLFATHASTTFESVDHALIEVRNTWINRRTAIKDEARVYSEFLDKSILQIAIVDAQGFLTYSSLGMPKAPTFLGDREHIRVHQDGLQDKLFVSRPLKGRVSGLWSIQLSRPIFDKGQFAGVVVMSVNPNYFVNFYNKADLGSDGVAVMIRDTGDIMVRSGEQDKYVGQVVSLSNLVFTQPGAPLQGSYRGFGRLDGVERLFSYVRMPEYGLTLLIGPSIDERLAPVHRQQRHWLISALIVTGITLLMSWRLWENLTRKGIAEQALRESQIRLKGSHELLQKLSQHVPGMIFQYRRFPDGHSTYPYVSDGVQDIYEVTPEVMRRGGHPARSSLIAQDRDALKASIDESARTLTLWQHEYRVHLPQRGLRWLSGRAQPERLDDGSILWHGFISDITEIKAIEAALNAAKESAEAANRTKGEFLANMSHEIRTPMNAIIGMSYLALQTELSVRQRNYIEKVHRAGNNLLGIINDILDFSKIEAGKMAMEAVEFRLEDVMENLAEMVVLKMEDKGLELLFDTDLQVPTALVGDPLRLGQILINLASNAVKFTDQGEIVIGVRTLAQAGESVELHFWVQDKGIGMTPEQCARMFQAFSQADTSTTRKYGGTGLGLVIAKSLVERMHGRIWVHSTPGQGSVFHFSAQFGLQRQAVARREFNAEELLGVRALVVDDSASAREILSTMARNLGLQVDVAQDGAQALALVALADEKGQPYDLVLVDWKMPGMDGVQTVQALQQRQGLGRVPAVIMVTAYGREEALMCAEQNGVELKAVLTKPASATRLVEAIGQALGKGVPKQPDAAGADHKPDSPSHSGALAQLRGARVLLVEDNDMNQELALDLLGQNGIEAVLAVNGQQALETLERDGHFDAVLMDCQMPVMDGYTATREIRKRAAFKDLPIIAMTADVMAGDHQKVLDAGMWDHIAKPINVAEMFNTMARWIRPAASQGTTGAGADRAAAPGSPDEPGTPGEPDRWLQALALAGVDTQAGLATTMHNAKLYRRMLLKFRDGQGRFAQLFSQARLDADPSAPERCAHTLKGTAATIGAGAVQHAAAGLERACRDGAPEAQVQALLEQALAALAPVIDGLRALDADTGTGPTDLAADADTAPDQAQLEALGLRLRALLLDDDAQALELWEDNEALFKAAYPNHWRRIAASLSGFDFDIALETLREVLPA
jgi:signal transduction histidine kinase/CheY-like chemotaxis protein